MNMSLVTVSNRLVKGAYFEYYSFISILSCLGGSGENEVWVKNL
jgi:hypothetical protein